MLYTNRNCYQEATETVAGNITYYGQAEHGTKITDETWRIWRDITIGGVNYTTFPTTKPGQENTFSFKWSDRTTITFFDPTI